MGPDPNDDKEVSTFNWVVRWTNEGITFEVDPRHVENLLRMFEMKGCRSVTTPGVKPRGEDEE